MREQLPVTNIYSLGYENKEVNVFCELSNDEQYGKVLEEALLFDSFYCDKLNEQFCRKEKKSQSHKYSKSELEHFINQYKVKQIRMSKKNIGDMNKTDYSNHYY